MERTRADLLFLLFFPVILQVASGQLGGNNYFTTPPPQGVNDVNSDNHIYYLGQSVPLAWVTELKQFALQLWQNETQISVPLLSNSSTTNSSWTWVVDLSVGNETFDLSPPNNAIFILALYDESGTKGAISPTCVSHAFNISMKSSNAATSTALSSTQPPSTSSTSSILQQASASASATSAPDMGGLSTGQKAGVGVGVSLAGLLAVAVVAWFLFFRKSKNNATPEAIQVDNSIGKTELPAGSVGIAQTTRFQKRAEMP